MGYGMYLTYNLSPMTYYLSLLHALCSLLHALCGERSEPRRTTDH